MENEKHADGQTNEDGKNDENGQHSLGLHDLYRAAFSEEYTGKPEHDSYEIYAMKPLAYGDSNQACFTVSSTPPTYEAFDSKYNSVLDLDKGVTVETVQGEPVGPVTTYVCDSQILQRYLHDASISLYKEDQDGQAVYTAKPLLTEGGGLGIAPEKLGVKYSDCDFNSSDSFASTESIIPKTIQCPSCPKTFMFKADLTRHKKHKHTPKQKFVCSVCNKEFVCQQNLSIHERCHSKIPDLSCHPCSLTFKSHKQFVEHMETVHENTTPFHCHSCPRAYRKASDLVNHLKKFHDKKEGSVGKPADKKNKLSSHMTIQNTERRYSCEMCQKKFKSERALMNHAKKHESVLVIVNKPSAKKTGSAPKVENQPQLLQSSMRLDVTSIPKDFGVASKNGDEIKGRKKMHRKKFTCPECSKEFLTRKAMSLHITSEHIRTQETCTQTDLFELQNVNVVMDSEGRTSQPIIITPLTNYNSVPLILAQPSVVHVPFSASQ